MGDVKEISKKGKSGKIKANKRLLDVEDKMSETFTRMSRSMKCDVRCAASSCPRHRHGVKHRPGDFASMLRFSRELLLKPNQKENDKNLQQSKSVIINNTEDNLGNGDGEDEIRNSEFKMDSSSDPFDMLKSAMEDLKPSLVEKKYDAENIIKPFPRFDATVPDEEESLFSELEEKQEGLRPKTWRCTSNIGVQTETIHPFVTKDKVLARPPSIKNTNSVIIPVNSNMQLSITVVPMQVGPAISKTIIRCNSAGDSGKTEETKIFTRMEVGTQAKHEMTLHFIKENSDNKNHNKCMEVEKIEQSPGDISPVSISETIIDLNEKSDKFDESYNEDNKSVKPKSGNHNKTKYLEFPLVGSKMANKMSPITMGGSDGITHTFDSTIFDPKKFAQAMRYSPRDMQTRCVRTLSQVRRQFQREFAPLHDELSYIQNRVRCIFRYTAGIDVSNKVPEEVKRSTILSTIFRRADVMGEPETKRSWPDHIRKYPSCSVCTSFSAIAMQKNKKSCDTLFHKDSKRRKAMVVQPSFAHSSVVKSNPAKPFTHYPQPIKSCSPPRPIVSVTLDGARYPSHHTVPRPATARYSENSSRKEAFFTSTISYFMDNRARQREVRTARRYNTEKVCSWKTPHSKRDFTLHTKRHGLDDSSSISTVSVFPSDHTISIDSVICKQGPDGSVVYE